MFAEQSSGWIAAPPSRSPMFECLILGDSTGLGTARAINATHSAHCDVMAIEGATTSRVVGWRMAPKRYGTTILSVGSNDRPTPGLKHRLVRLRKKLVTRRVIWLLPYARENAGIVNSVAIYFHDESLDLARFPSRDKLHPSRYLDVAKALLK